MQYTTRNHGINCTFLNIGGPKLRIATYLAFEQNLRCSQQNNIMVGGGTRLEILRNQLVGSLNES